MKKFDKRAKTSALAAGLIALLLMVIIVGGVLGYLVYTGKLSFGEGGGPSTGGGGKGTYEIAANALNSLSGAATVGTFGTDTMITYYSKVNGLWNRLQSAGATAGGMVAVTLTGNEGGYIYAVCQTSSSYYVDKDETASSNNGVTFDGYELVITGVALPQYVFKINLNGITPGIRAAADYVFNLYCISYDASVAFNTVPANQTGIGTAANTTYLPWYMKMSAANVGIAVRSITLAVNETDTTQFTLYKQNVPGVAYLSGGSLAPSPQSNQIVYTWTAPTDPTTGAVDLGSCVFWTFSSTSINKFDLTTGISTTLSAGKRHMWTITIYWLTPAGAGGSATQTMQYATTI